jgi:hypothetical protein
MDLNIHALADVDVFTLALDGATPTIVGLFYSATFGSVSLTITREDGSPAAAALLPGDDPDLTAYDLSSLPAGRYRLTVRASSASIAVYMLKVDDK